MAGLYFHIPFCKSKCLYCDFYSIADTGLRHRLPELFAAEMEREKGFLTDWKLRTIYFGGGTPSLLDAGAIKQILQHTANLWDTTALQETTLEANPDDLTPQYLNKIREAGIDRLSIGIQSFLDSHLTFMGRRHDAEAATKAVINARKAGFGNISIDLIYGLPDLTSQDWRETLAAACELNPEHISAYHLTVEDNTPLGRMSAKGHFRPCSEEVSEEHFNILHQTLTAAGYEHYEISNFALPGRRSRHNSSYWTGQQYLGIGPGAHSYNGLQRRWFEGTMQDYAGGSGAYGLETLSEKDRYNEYIMTALRTADGVEAAILRSFGKEREESFMRQAYSFEKEGLIITENGKIRIPANRFLLSDGIMSAFFET